MHQEDALLATAYRYFLAVAETGSIRGAAKELNIVASAVNRQILLLERRIGIALFERVGRGLRLSDAGALLVRHLRDVLSSHEDAAAELDAFRGLKRGRIRVATVESVSVNLLPDLLTRFWLMYPGIEVAVTVTGSEAVTRMTAESEVDIGFTFNPISSVGLSVIYEKGYRIGALVVPDHPVAARESVSLSDLVQYPLAIPARGLSLRAALDPALQRLRTPVRPRMVADSLRLMAALARREGLVAFQTTVGIEHELAAGSVVLIPLSDPEIPIDRFVVLGTAGRTASLAVHVFQDFIRSECASSAAAET